MSQPRSCVVITHAPEMDFRKDYVVLPRNYGAAEYFSRPDVQAIHHLIEGNLTTLDAKTGFTKQLKDKKVLIKPNLVTVYSGMGLKEYDYPETTDPRVIDATVAFLKRFTDDIVIVESSGRGVPTRGSFRVVGLDRLARYYNIGLVALEEQVTVRYILPKAKVQKEIVVPEIFGDVVTGRAFYVSIPKMKTNIYTGVTLGFKNAMGTLPYNLRQRNHHFAIDQKLVDMLHLFKPNLTIIDGLVGGEGNCPAPVDPVDSRVIISGNNSVETDRVATRMMGFDPSSIRLMTHADEAGFGDPDVEVIGEETITPFRPADPRFMSETFRRDFPNVTVLTGHRLPHAPKVSSLEDCSPALSAKMEMACRGGCLATTHFAFDMFMKEGQRCDFHLVLIIGGGLEINGERYYLDHAGKPYTIEQVKRMKGRKLVVGSCSRLAAPIADRFVDGCMPFPNSPHVALHALTGTFCTVVSPKNRHLVPLLVATLQMCEARKKLYRAGHRLDVPLTNEHVVVEPPQLTLQEQEQDFVPWPLPPLTPEEIRAVCVKENRAVLATFLG
jgi:uncharacterized protein (DUF362 family)